MHSGRILYPIHTIQCNNERTHTAQTSKAKYFAQSTMPDLEFSWSSKVISVGQHFMNISQIMAELLQKIFKLTTISHFGFLAIILNTTGHVNSVHVVFN